jgi:hypothetical protein
MSKTKMNQAADYNVIPASSSLQPSWNDYEAIRQVISGYCHIVDRAVAKGETPDTSQLYHPNAEYSNSFQEGEVCVGHEAVVAWYHKFLGQRSGYYKFMRHKIYEPFILIHENTAAVITHFDADSVDRHRQIRAISGRYNDSMIKHNGKWLISKRHVDVHYHFVRGEAQRYVGWGRDKPGSADGWETP